MLTNVAIVNGQDARIRGGHDNAEDGHNSGQAKADHIKWPVCSSFSPLHM